MFALSRVRQAANVLASRSTRRQFSTTVARRGGQEHWRMNYLMTGTDRYPLPSDAVIRWYYREMNQNPPRSATLLAEGIMFVAWYWVLYHLWYEWDHFIGHDLPNPKDWTNEELGIPPDDVD